MNNFNKKLLFGFGAAAVSFAGICLLKQKLPFSPNIPATDENTILLFQFRFSPFCLKVAKIMDYKGIPFKTVDLLPIAQKKFVKDLSGQNLVPVIKHKDKTIYDSTSIAKYLEEIAPEPSIYIKDDENLNKEVILLEDWADEAFEPVFRDLAYIYVFEHPEIILESDDYNTGLKIIDNNIEKIAPIVTKLKLKDYGVDSSKKEQLKKRAREYMDLLLVRLEGKKFLVGDRLTIADITLASHLTVAQKVPYIHEDDDYAMIFEWQKGIFDATKRRIAISK